MAYQISNTETAIDYVKHLTRFLPEDVIKSYTGKIEKHVKNISEWKAEMTLLEDEMKGLTDDLTKENGNLSTIEAQITQLEGRKLSMTEELCQSIMKSDDLAATIAALMKKHTSLKANEIDTDP